MSNNTRRRRYAFNETNITNNTTNIIGNINKGISRFYNTTKKNDITKKNDKKIKKNIYTKLNFKTRFIDFGFVYSNDLSIIDIKKYKYDYFIWPFETRFIYDINYKTLSSSVFYKYYNSFQNTLKDYYNQGNYNSIYHVNPYANILSVLYTDYDIDDVEMNKWYKYITNKINSKYTNINDRRLFYAKATDIYSLGIALAGKYASITNHFLNNNWRIVNKNNFKSKTDEDNNLIFLKNISRPFYKLIKKMININPLNRINIS